MEAQRIEGWVNIDGKKCDSGSCPEFFFTDGSVMMRESAAPNYYVVFDRPGWTEFIQGVKEGKLDGK